MPKKPSAAFLFNSGLVFFFPLTEKRGEVGRGAERDQIPPRAGEQSGKANRQARGAVVPDGRLKDPVPHPSFFSPPPQLLFRKFYWPGGRD